MALVRCFVASFVEPAVAQTLAATISASPGMLGVSSARCVPAENYHATLWFIGATAPDEVDHALAEVRKLSGTPLSVHVAAVTGLPKPGRASVVVALLDVPEVMYEWRRRLAASFGPEPKRFTPHVTVGRLRPRRAVVVDDGIAGMPLQLSAPALYQSVTIDGGACYRRVKTT